MAETEKNEDRRIRRTDRLIFNALCTLTQRKSIDELSVSEICKEADISRQAFYSRFRDGIDALEKYIDGIYEEGMQIPVPYETPEARSKKLHQLWEDNLETEKLVLVSARSEYIYNYFVKMVAKLYTDLNKVPRTDLKDFKADEINYEFEMLLASIHTKMLKHQIETNSDGSYERDVMNRFFKNLKSMKP